MKILNILILVFEAAGLIVLFYGGISTFVNWAIQGVKNPWFKLKEQTELRFEFGHSIVFALEFFIAADVIRSIEAPSLQELAKLAVIVVIRTILHYSLR